VACAVHILQALWPNDPRAVGRLIRVDFYDEGSVHADVVGGREGSGQRLRQRLAQLRGFGWWKHRA
jgi:hypothetical protein